MDYTEWYSTISAMTVITNTTELDTIFPACINDAEGMCYRDLDLVNLNVRDSSASTAALTRNFNLPTTLGTFQIVTGINIITPAATAPDSGTRNQCTPVSLEVLDRIYPSAAGAGVPSMFAYISQSTLAGQSNLVFGPWPDAIYRVEVEGKVQWTPLSASNTTTFLTLYYPDLFVAASMVFMTGYKGNYGAQADDPRSAMSWKQHYQDLLANASPYEARKRMAGASWTPKQLEPTAQAQRG